MLSQHFNLMELLDADRLVDGEIVYLLPRDELEEITHQLAQFFLLLASDELTAVQD